MSETIEKVHYDHREIEVLTQDICTEIEADKWVPDIIAGIGRGGLLPGVMISHYFDAPFYALNWSTRDHTRQVSESALVEEITESGLNVLIVDDICDTGETLDGMIKDWQGQVHEELDLGGQIRIATLHFRRSCSFEVDYIGEFIEDEWIVYPFEAWWH